jgi:hypothetical protein
MKTHIKTFISLSFLIFAHSSFAQTRPSYQLNIYDDSVKVKSIKNFQKLEYIDTQGFLHNGKVYFYNDSQFCFVDYFLEPKSDTISLNSVKKLSVAMKLDKTKNKGGMFRRRYYSADKVLIICLATSFYGAAVFLIRELYLTIKEGPRHSYKYQNFENEKSNINKKYRLAIEPITTSSN